MRLFPVSQRFYLLFMLESMLDNLSYIPNTTKENSIRTLQITMVRGMNKTMVPKTARNPSLNEKTNSINGNKTNPTLYIHRRIVADHILLIENN